MRGAVLYGPREVRVEERDAPKSGLERGPRAGKGLLGELPRRLSGPPDSARGRRLLHGFVLLSVGLNLSAGDWTPRRALASCRGERPLSRSEPGDGLAARRFSRIDGKELARSNCGTLAARRRPLSGDVSGDASLRVVGCSC